MAALDLNQVAVELVSLQPDGRELRLGGVTESLSWSEQTGDMTVTVNATLQNLPNAVGGNDLWTALGGAGGRFRLDATWDGQTTYPIWEGSAWQVEFRSTGRESIELVCYDDLRTLLTDEVWYIGPNSIKGEAASSWVQRVLTDGGPAMGDVSKPTTVIRQYIFQGQPRGQIIDQVLRWAFYRTPATVNGEPNPEKQAYMLQMRHGDAGWTANTLPPGTNSLVLGFDASSCADFSDHQSIEDLTRQVSLYSQAALVQSAPVGDVSISPFAAALDPAHFQIQTSQNGQGATVQSIVQVAPDYVPPANLGPLRRVLGGGGADNPQQLTEFASDTLSVYGQPWKTRTVVVPLCPFIRRGDVHHFAIGTLNDSYPVTGVVHDWGKRQSVLTLDTSGVLGRRVLAQSYIGLQDVAPGSTGDAATGDTAGLPGTPLTPATLDAVIRAATDPAIRNTPYAYGGAEGRSAMDSAAGFVQAGGTDCSGLVSWAFFVGGGIDLRDNQRGVTTLSLQAKSSKIDPSAAQAGDLVFYNMDQGDMHIQHVAIYLGNGQKVQEGGSASYLNIAAVNDIGTPTYRRLNV